MAVLLDTHTFIWYYQGSSQLSHLAQQAIENAQGEFYISIASFWEIAIKIGLGRLALDTSLETLFQDVVSQGYLISPIGFSHLLQYGQLSFRHRDPFDRLIVSQALVEKWDLISKDEMLDPYLRGNPIQRIW